MLNMGFLRGYPNIIYQNKINYRRSSKLFLLLFIHFLTFSTKKEKKKQKKKENTTTKGMFILIYTKLDFYMRQTILSVRKLNEATGDLKEIAGDIFIKIEHWLAFETFMKHFDISYVSTEFDSIRDTVIYLDYLYHSNYRKDDAGALEPVYEEETEFIEF
jgi:hypothetical protein